MKRILFKILRFGFFALVCLVTLLALVIAEENFRGKRAWEDYHREQEARGERLDFTPLIPPPVPDDQNFAMTPLLRPLFPDGNKYGGELSKKLSLPSPTDDSKIKPKFGDRVMGTPTAIDDWKTLFDGQDVLVAMQKYDPELREISEAARRPHARFPIAYAKGFEAITPHFSVLLQFTKLHALRACAALEEGQTDAAFSDVQTIFRLGESMKDEPLLISELVRISIWQIGLNTVWEGLSRHCWSDAQLSVLQTDLERPDFIAGLMLAFHGERAFANEMLLKTIAKPDIVKIILAMSGDPKTSNGNSWLMNQFLRFVTSGWIYQNMLTINRFYDATVFSATDPAALRTLSTRFQAEAARLKESAFSRRFGIPVLNPYKMLAAILLPSLDPVTTRLFYAQVSVDEGVIACALERYRLANGKYPATLESLVPIYVKTLPQDAATGKPLHYRLKDDGSFLLYSTGADQKDDGGKVATKPNGAVDINQGDWVWSLKPL